jgi:uncharacterized membrane protein
LAHVAVFVFFRDRPTYPAVAIGVSVVTVACMLSTIFFGKRTSLRAIGPAQRRRIISTWLATFVGMVLVLLTMLRMMRPTTPEEWFAIYALWLIVVGCTFFSLASNAGFLYLNGSLCFLLAILAPFIAFYMPLVAGLVISTNLTTVGLLLRRIAREATSQGTAAKTTKSSRG